MEVLAVGGPYDQQVLRLAHGSTFTFEAKGLKGSYLLSNETCKILIAGPKAIYVRHKTIWNGIK